MMIAPLRIRRPRGLGLVVVLLLAVTAVAAHAADLPYDTLFYTHDGLRLEAYFYKPAGNGPFPLVVYNHGSRATREHVEAPMQFIGQLLTSAGYAVLVPERRGYGKSDGTAFSDDIGQDRGPRFIARLQAEADDVLAALKLTEQLPVDTTRVAIMGWSFGGIVTTLAAGRSTAFVAAVNQAPAALNWDRVPTLRDVLIAAAGKSRIPMLCMAAKNDATTENATRICEATKKHGSADTNVIIYPAFTPTTPVPGNVAPGHVIFSQQGVDLWSKDALAFLAKYLQKT